MDWQLFLVIALVMVALFYLGWQTLRTWRGKGASCGGCKCSGSARTVDSETESLIPLDQVRLRRR